MLAGIIFSNIYAFYAVTFLSLVFVFFVVNFMINNSFDYFFVYTFATSYPKLYKISFFCASLDIDIVSNCDF